MEWGIVCTVVGTGLGIIGFIYTLIRNFKKDIKENFEKHEKRFEMIDQRLFLLCMGKTLPEILKSERNVK